MSSIESTRCDKCERTLGYAEARLCCEIGGADFCQSCASTITLREAFDLAHRLQHARDAANFAPFLDPKEPF